MGSIAYAQIAARRASVTTTAITMMTIFDRLNAATRSPQSGQAGTSWSKLTPQAGQVWRIGAPVPVGSSGTDRRLRRVRRVGAIDPVADFLERNKRAGSRRTPSVRVGGPRHDSCSRTLWLGASFELISGGQLIERARWVRWAGCPESAAQWNVTGAG